ncbi:MAG: ABC transporter ATP-binding protein [Deltaproteobacteria bacterium]|nr:MAG: ABC transporter ATP-binding protein [Deltaproteobacteria bacterium]
MSQENALEASDITVRYGGVVAVDSLSLTVKKGEIRGLIGPNGAGKSTAIDAISGRNKSTGTVRLFGKDISQMSIVQRRMAGISRSFQRTSVFPEMKVKDQIALAAARIPGSVALDVMKAMDLYHLREFPAKEIGYGDQRRLDLALAFIGRPPVLLLDEPMAGLSVEESENLALHLQKLTKEWGVGLLLVEHDMEIVFAICDQLSVLETGKLIAEGVPAEVRANERVKVAYLGSSA